MHGDQFALKKRKIQPRIVSESLHPPFDGNDVPVHTRAVGAENPIQIGRLVQRRRKPKSCETNWQGLDRHVVPNHLPGFCAHLYTGNLIGDSLQERMKFVGMDLPGRHERMGLDESGDRGFAQFRRRWRHDRPGDWHRAGATRFGNWPGTDPLCLGRRFFCDLRFGRRHDNLGARAALSLCLGLSLGRNFLRPGVIRCRWANGCFRWRLGRLLRRRASQSRHADDATQPISPGHAVGSLFKRAAVRNALDLESPQPRDARLRLTW